jgi:hypothetical protein
MRHLDGHQATHPAKNVPCHSQIEVNFRFLWLTVSRMYFSYVKSPADTELLIWNESDSIIWGPDSRKNTGSVPSVV